MSPLDYRNRLPIYEQLNKSISKVAILGALESNGQLPPVRTLVQDLGINPNIVQKVYQLLGQNGIIYPVPGKGSYISPDLFVLSRQKSRALEKLSEAIANAAGCRVIQPEMIRWAENHFDGRGSEQRLKSDRR